MADILTVCPTCGGTDIREGGLFSYGGVYFAEKGDEKKLLNNHISTLECRVCRSCGAVFDIRLTKPEKLK